MFRELGYLLLVFCFLTSVYGTFSAALCQWTKQKSLLISSRVSNLYTSILCFLACCLLSYSFWVSDYSLLYVYKNSSSDLPYFYRISALWSSLEGSHLLWTFLLSLCSTVSLWSFRHDNESFIPLASVLLQGILSWMYFLTLSSSNPFEASFPIPDNGLGMNELLQNPYMAIHPPCLFLGYTALAIPFAYSFASVWLGRLTGSVLITIRRWALFSWIFLTIGIFLGGRWAYVELGWAGYWAWDPVENSSLMPWLFVTAFLHTLLVIRQHGEQQRLLFVFSFLSFFFCFFGTFLTRSGMVSSVHSFAQSDVAVSYLAFLSLLLGVFVLTYSFRGHRKLTLAYRRYPYLYHLDLLTLGQLLFVSFASIILMGTLYPMVSEFMTGVRFSVQAPYFNSFAPYIGFSFIFLMTLGNFVRKKGAPRLLSFKSGSFLLSSALLMSFLFCYWGDVFSTESLYGLSMQLVGVFLCFLSAVLFVFDFWKKSTYVKVSFLKFLRLNSGNLGSLLSHLGVLVAILGFLGNYRGVTKVVTLERGESVPFHHYSLGFEALELKQVSNMMLYEAVVSVSKQGKTLGSIHPGRAQYPTKKELIHEIDYASNFWHDLYLTLIDFDIQEGKWATFEIRLSPTVRLVWMSAFFLVLGGLLSLFSIKRRKRASL